MLDETEQNLKTKTDANRQRFENACSKMEAAKGKLTDIRNKLTEIQNRVKVLKEIQKQNETTQVNANEEGQSAEPKATE